MVNTGFFTSNVISFPFPFLLLSPLPRRQARRGVENGARLRAVCSFGAHPRSCSVVGAVIFCLPWGGGRAGLLFWTSQKGVDF